MKINGTDCTLHGYNDLSLIGVRLMLEQKVTCDNCNADLTNTGAMPRFRLRLSSEGLTHNSDMIYAVMVFPEIERDHHFCSKSCLREWLGEGDH
jgi:hypothetical protein